MMRYERYVVPGYPVNGSNSKNHKDQLIINGLVEHVRNEIQNRNSIQRFIF